jgi:hypothetical protein
MEMSTVRQGFNIDRCGKRLPPFRRPTRARWLGIGRPHDGRWCDLWTATELQANMSERPLQSSSAHPFWSDEDRQAARAGPVQYPNG